MIEQSEAIIYLGSKRGCVENVNYRSYRTFNFGEYVDEQREAFNNLIAFNDDVLAAGETVNYKAETDVNVVIVPVAGHLRISINQSIPKMGEVRKLYTFFLKRGDVFTVQNIEGETINFLNIWKKTEDHTFNSTKHINEFELVLDQNIMASFRYGAVEDSLHGQMYIGKFGGRAECKLKLKSSKLGAFVFVLEGAFEINNRLLQARDGLALWNVEEVEFEALSNDAILIIIE